MAVHGYLTHAAQNRRRTIWLILAYVLGFELLGAFLSTMILLILDEEHTILSDPLGYLLRYGPAIAALAGFIFWRLYRGHAGSVARRLDIRMVTRWEEPRFVDIAEAQCVALGVRLPRFGVLEASEPNAITVGEGPTAGMIAVTRGLLDALDDDELAAVVAHEAAHIRLGDTRLLAANHALMRTAVILQTHNPLRLEDWRQMILPLLLPPMLVLMLIGTIATMAAMQLAGAARRGLKLGRDHIADGEAVRVTHFPDALIDAIREVAGRGAFPGSYAVAGMLFDAPADHEGGRRATARSRMEAIATLGGAMMDPGRVRRDTRDPTAPRAGFGRRGLGALAAVPFARSAEGKPLQQPPTPTPRMLWLRFTDPQAFREWQDACTDWWEWRVGDRRNGLGLKPAMVLPVAATTLVMAVLHWPADGDLRRYARLFNPATMVDVARSIGADRRCGAVTGGVGPCGGSRGPSVPQASVMQTPGRPTRSEEPAAAPSEDPIRPFLPENTVPVMMLALIVVAIVRPGWLKQLFGQTGYTSGRNL